MEKNRYEPDLLKNIRNYNPFSGYVGILRENYEVKSIPNTFRMSYSFKPKEYDELPSQPDGVKSSSLSEGLKIERSSKAVKDVLLSGTAACIAEIATLPICTLKTNYQTSESKNITHVFRNMLNDTKDRSINGLIKRFYNSSGWAVSSQILSTASKFAFYEEYKKHIDNTFIAGTLCGLSSSILTHPFDFVKYHKQIGEPIVSKIQQDGISMVYRGYSKTAVKAAVGSTFYFPLFDKFKILVNERKEFSGCAPLTKSMISGVCSSVISTTILQPIDYMKVRQICGKEHWSKSSKFYDIRPYFKGLSLNLLRIIPHFTIMMTTIDYLRSSSLLNL